ncbi:MAG: protein kinase domain-containing protein, partial [Polyangiaceae bacterium]
MEDAAQEDPVPQPKFAPPAIHEYVLPLGVRLSSKSEYIPIQRLGAGGMGTVYKARKPPGILSAIKVMHRDLAKQPAFVERFMQEIAVTAMLESHPNLVKVKDCGQLDDDTPFYGMEFLEGKALVQVMLVARRGRGLMEPHTAYVIGEQFCEALTWLHSQGIVHRDFKPENV